MSNPTFVNAGTPNSGVGSSPTSSLPGSRVNGNILFALVYVSGGAVGFSIGGGWTIGGIKNGNDGGDAAWAWRIVDGAEADPAWTIDFTSWHSEVKQYTGNVSSSPIGAKTSGQGDDATIVVPAVTTERDTSTIVGLLTVSANTTITTPTGFTARNTNSSGSSLTVDETTTTAGDVSDAVSAAVPSNPWSGFLIELCSVAPPPGPHHGSVGPGI